VSSWLVIDLSAWSVGLSWGLWHIRSCGSMSGCCRSFSRVGGRDVGRHYRGGERGQRYSRDVPSEMAGDCDCAI